LLLSFFREKSTLSADDVLLSLLALLDSSDDDGDSDGAVAFCPRFAPFSFLCRLLPASALPADRP
jgi:hypothetical protein